MEEPQIAVLLILGLIYISVGLAEAPLKVLADAGRQSLTIITEH